MKIGELLSDLDNTFFNSMPADLPWWDVVPQSDLALHYLAHSGMKWTSPIVRVLSEDMDTMNGRIAALFKPFYPRWRRLYDTYLLEYNPIENYNMIEQLKNDNRTTTYGRTNEHTYDITDSEQGQDQTTYGAVDTFQHGHVETTVSGETDTETLNTTDTTTYNVTDKTTPNLETKTVDKVRGFNSSSDVQSGSQDQTATGTNTEAKTGTEALARTGTDTHAKNGTDTLTNSGSDVESKTGTDTLSKEMDSTRTGTETDEQGGQDTETHSYTLTRSGNIGVTTSQQMLEQERNILAWDFFNDVLFRDIDKVLALSVY